MSEFFFKREKKKKKRKHKTRTEEQTPEGVGGEGVYIAKT